MPEFLVPSYVEAASNVVETGFDLPTGEVVCIDIVENGVHSLTILDDSQNVPTPGQGRYPFTERLARTEHQRVSDQISAKVLDDIVTKCAL